MIHPGPAHLFLSVGIYYVATLAEIAQVTVVLLKRDREALPQEVVKILDEKGVRLTVIDNRRLLEKHRIFTRETARLFETKFDHLLIDNDMGELNVYLTRAAKRCGCPVTCFQTGASIGPIRNDYIYTLRVLGGRWAKDRNLPAWVGRRFMATDMHLRHFWQYWVAPLLCGKRPFMGKSSLYLRTALNGHRDGERQIVYDTGLRDLYLAEGMTADRIHLIEHPLLDPLSQEIFYRLHGAAGGDEVVVFVDFPQIKRNDITDISDETVMQTGKIIGHVRSCIPTASIVLKAHPALSGDVKLIEGLKALTREFACAKLIDTTIDGASLIPRAKFVIGQQTTLLDLARNLGQFVVISVGYSQDLPNGPFRENHGIHCFRDVPAFLKCDLPNLTTSREFDQTEMDDFRSLVTTMKLLSERNRTARDV